MLKFISWNVNSLRACYDKGFADAFNRLEADFFCLQETKMQEGQLDVQFEGYQSYWNYAEKTKPRSFLQNTGILIRKELNMPNFFTNRMLEDIKVYENYCDGVIISDVRFKDEIEIIKKYYHNVICINIESDFEQSTLNNKEKLHISEHDLDDYENFDFIIRNNKDILSLKEEILEKVVKE